MKIEGETIRKAADHAQGAGKTLEPALRGVNNVLGEVGTRLVHGMPRKARLVEFKEARFDNAEDWTAAEDGAITVHASVVQGGATVDLSEPVEFVHYGRVYRDRSHLFPCPKLDDQAMRLVLPPPQDPKARAAALETRGQEIPAHGLFFRAALQREAILLGGFIRAQMDALAAEEQSKGAIGVIAQVIADLTGSAGGTQDKPNAVDLNPHLKKVIKAAELINKAKIDYVALHTCGVELHTARRAYREYLVDEIEKRHAPAKTPKPGGGILNDQVDEVNESLAAGAKWLGKKPAEGEESKHDAVPRLTSIIPPSMQDFLSLAQKISFKAWDVCALLHYEYAVRLEPFIEDACRRVSTDALKKRSTPVFPTWFMAPQPDYALPADIEQRIFDRVDNPLQKGDLPNPFGSLAGPLNQLADVITDPIKAKLVEFDNKVGIDKTLDFLSRPDRYTPGRPYLDDIFLIPPDPDAPDVPDAGKRARVGWSGGLGQMAVDSLKAALKVETMPAFLEFTVSKISTVCAEFVRAVYGKLLVLDPAAEVTESELHEAAKRHLVGNVVESILGGLGFVDKLRTAKIDLPIAEVAVSVDALIGRAKEFATLKLEKFIEPVVKYAMRDLHGMIFAYRKTAIENGALTMEVHLAQLPSVFSRMFRNVFFPLWDKVLERSIEAVSASLMPRLADAGRVILKAREQSEMVRGKMVQALAALDTLPAALPAVAFDFKDPKGSIKKIKSDWNPIAESAKKAWEDADIDETQDLGPLDHDPLEQAFPVQKRLSRVEILPVTGEHLKLVAPQLKWRSDQEQQLDLHYDESGGPGVPSTVANQAPGTGGSGPGPRPDRGPPKIRPTELGNIRGVLADRPGGLGTSSTTFTPAQGTTPNMPTSPQLPQPQVKPSVLTTQNGLSQIAPHIPAPQQGPTTVPSPNVIPAQSSPGLLQAPVPSSLSSEKTEELGPISSELKKLADLDLEQTVDLDQAALSSLPPFLGALKKP